jgi:histone H3
MDLTSLVAEINLVNDDIAEHPDELTDTDDEHISDSEEDEGSVKSDEEESDDEDESVQLDDGSDSEGIRLMEDEASESACETVNESACESIISATAPRNAAVKRARHADRKALADIRRIQAKTDYLIPFAPFNRLVREIASDYKTDLRFTKNAVLALQTASESNIIGLMQLSQLMALHGGRVGIMPKDLQLACMAQHGV